MSILEMTLTGGVMALVITALRAFLLNKLPKRTFVLLWEVAMLRLVLPISIPTVTSVYSLLALFSNSAATARTVPGTTVTNIPIVPNAVTEGNLQAGVSMPVCAIVWLVGMIIMSAVFAAGYIIVYRRYRCAAIIKGGYVEEWLSEQKIRRNVRICCSEQAVSPLTYGILRPTILLPESLENKQSEQLAYVLTHEMTHIGRFDMLRKIAAAAVLCMHWFNPVVWLLYLLYNRDIELACDEAVVRKMKGDCRSAYAMALIGMEERRRGFSSLNSYFSKNAIEERIVAIMKTKKIGVVPTLAALALVLSVTCGFATSAATNEIDDYPNPVEIRRYDPNVFETAGENGDKDIFAMESPDFEETIERMRQLSPDEIDDMRERFKGDMRERLKNESEDQGKKPHLYYIFDDESIREVSEDEFQSVLGKNKTIR